MLQRLLGQVNSKVDPIQETDIKSIPALVEKLYFIQFRQEDIARIHRIAPLINKYAYDISKRHFDMLCSVPQTKKMIDQYSSEKQFIDTYVNYVESLGSFEANEKFLYIRKQIGLVHSHIKLSAEWFVASFSRFYEFLIPAIFNEMSADKASATIISLQKLLTLDAQIALEAYEEAHDYKFVQTNSEIIESIIQIDKMRPLLNSVDISMNEAMSISAATEQLSASVQEVATQAVKVAENSEEMVHFAREGQRSINDTLQGIVTMTDDFQDMRKQFKKLSEAVENMTDVVSFISEVADQTSLLALNAAIEAARAGEEGRGFAVVASEVRKLSEQTSQSVVQIRNMITTVQSTANEVDVMTEKMEQSVADKSNKTQHAISNLDQIIEQIMEVGNTTSNIAAIIEEQSAATDDISFRSAELLNQMHIIENNSKQTGQALYDVSVTINDLRNGTIKYMSSLTAEHTIRIVKTDHLLWRWWAYNSILGYHKLDTEIVQNAHECRLGQWYDDMQKNDKIAQLPAYHAVDAPHQLVHKQVLEVAKLLENNDHTGALKGLEAIEATSSIIVDKLDELYHAMKPKR